MHGDVEAVPPRGHGRVALIEEYGLTLLKGIYSIDVGFAETLAEDLDRAEHVLRRGHDALTEMGDLGVRSTVDAILADVLFTSRAGTTRRSSFAERAARSRRRRPRLPAAVAGSDARASSARRGAHDEALDLLREAVELVEPIDFLELQGLRPRGPRRGARAPARTSEAEAALEQAVGFHHAKGNVVSAGRLRAVLDGLRAARPS